MATLNLPPFEAKIRQDGGRYTIFDEIRGRFVALTPEEWVRQHFVNFLVRHKGYPIGLMANEVQLRVGQKVLRCDSVLYSPRLQPRIIIEYKAPSVALSRETILQAAAYNYILHADYIFLSNGLNHLCFSIDHSSRRIKPLAGVPAYKDLAPL